MHGEGKSKIMQINGKNGREIGAERGKTTTVEVLLSFELPFQWNGNSLLVGCLSICRQQEHLSPKGIQFSLRLQLSQRMAKIDTGCEFEVFKEAYDGLPSSCFVEREIYIGFTLELQV